MHRTHAPSLTYHTVLFVVFLCTMLPGALQAQTIVLTVNAIAGALGQFVVVAFGVAFIVFIIAVIRYIRKAGDDSEMSKARAGVGWALVGLLCIISIWGIVAILSTIFGIDTSKTECRSPSVVVSGSTYVLTSCKE